MLLIVIRAPPPLISTLFPYTTLFRSCWLPNARELGERVTAEVVPVPLRLTVCGLPAALSVTLRSEVLAPVVQGDHVIVSVQVPVTARVEGLRGQLLV